jgi:transcriptional regulator with XRE-family HTH domain
MDITPDEARISDAMRQFGERLKNIRVGLGYTQPDLATKLGCKRQTLSSWEQGFTTPDIKTLLRLKEQARTDEKNPIEVDLGELLGERKTDFGRTPLEYAIRLLQKIDVMGIRDVHPTRSEALTSFLPFLESEQSSICIVASSFLGVTRVAPEQVATVLSEKATEVKEFKILMTHPEMSQWREKQEGRAPGSIELEIRESVKLLESWGVRSENIKFWRGAPTIFLLFTPERMLANPYTYQTEAFKSVTVEIAPTKSRDDVFSQYSMNHFKRPFESGNSVTLVQLREEEKLREESGQVPKRVNRSRRS